jgi:ribosomal protein S14
MKYLLVKDKRRRVLFDYFEKRRKVLLALFQDLRLSERTRLRAYRLLVRMPRDTSLTRLRTRCTLTNRPRAVYRRFGLSRLMFRKLAWQGKLIGVKKASW